MKAFVTALFLFVSLIAHSQPLGYSKKYLKTMMRRQMVEIEQLKAENAKLKTLREEDRAAAESKNVNQIECEKLVANLRIELRYKEMQLNDRTQEKESAQQALQQSKTQVEVLANQIAELKMATPEYSTNSYVLPGRPQQVAPVVIRSYGAPRTSYITGPRGGCYYINSNGNKTYVDRSLCH